MKNKLIIIFDILFRNGQYLKATEDLCVKEKVVYPQSFYGRAIVEKEQSENMPDNVIFQQSLLEIFKNEDILKYVEVNKIELKDDEYFLKHSKRVAYDVKLTIIPEK